MTTLYIKNFGSIKKASLELRKVTIFTNQTGSEKIVRLISVLTLIDFQFQLGKSNTLLEYFFSDNADITPCLSGRTEIIYESKQTRIIYRNKHLACASLKYKYFLIPCIEHITTRTKIDLRTIENKPKNPIDLGISGLKLLFKNKYISLIDKKNKIRYASLSEDLTTFIEKLLILKLAVLETEQKNNLIKEEVNENNSIEKIIHSFLIIEKIEQNLAPTLLKLFLWELLKLINLNKHHQLIITTHSPFLINYITIAMQGTYLIENIMKSKINLEECKKEIAKIMPLEATLMVKDIIIYEDQENTKINETTFNPVKFELGLPSDENYLNSALAKTNDLFGELLRIEEQIENLTKDNT